MQRIFYFLATGLILLTMAEAQAQTILSGAGATFPAPLYQKWFSVFAQNSKVGIDYQRVGSGAGILKLLGREVDFGATDAFLTDQDMAAADADILHIPTCLGAVAIIYHLSEKPELNLTPRLLSDIFMGNIQYWNHPDIRAINPGTALSSTPITVIHRSTSSGTTYILTEYLSKTNRSWQQTIGYGKKVSWRAGVGVETNDDVAQVVVTIPGSIGYVSLSYAERLGLPAARILNRSGNYIKPTQKSVSLAANSELPADMRIMITDTHAPHGYPISAFTYLIVFREQAYSSRRMEKARALTALLYWIVEQGQQYNEALYYARLPRRAVQLSKKVIDTMTYDSRPLNLPDDEFDQRH